MRKNLYFVTFLVFVVLLSGCTSFQISGLGNFSENDCCFGLNYALLPDGQEFLLNYSYENGDYQYWRNDFGPAHAKTYVQLSYTEDVYKQAKSECQEYFTFSEEVYLYENFTFYRVNFAGGDTSLNANFPGFRLLGVDDASCSLVFIGYLNDNDSNKQITQSNISQFLKTQFGEWL